MSENKKVRNATVTNYNGITFKSSLEVTIYKTLIELGYNPEYEPRRFILVKGFRPTVPFYNRNKSKVFCLDNHKVRDITYTPDFILQYNGVLVIIEAKGKENDVFPVKKKLFRKLLEESKTPCMYFEVRTKKELLQAIEEIKLYGKKES